MGYDSKDVFKQLQCALDENCALKAHIKQLKHDINIFKQVNVQLKNLLTSQTNQINKQSVQIAELAAQNILQAKFLEKLTDEVDRLKKQINSNSSNSSLPPSKGQKTNIFNSREKSGKKSGGQPGHKGFHLSKSDIENKIAHGLVRHEIINHGIGENFVSKFTIDINVEVIATEHRFFSNIPNEFRPDVQYGDSIKTLSTMLVGRGIVASNRITELTASLTDGTIKLSDGSIYNWLAEFNNKAQRDIANIKTNLLNNPLLQVDETAARCEGKNMHARNYSTNSHVLYTLNQTKGKQAIKDDDILPRFTGAMMHDHNTINYNYGTRHSECNVHLIRYLKANFENTKNEWANDLANLLLASNTTRKIAIEKGFKCFTQYLLDRYQKRFDEILSTGFAANLNTKSRYFKKEELKLLRRLQKYKLNHLLFLEDFTIPFDNNLSERDLRTFKTKSKVSGCFRSLTGGRHFATLLSIIKTAIKQNQSPFHAVRNIFANAS